ELRDPVSFRLLVHVVSTALTRMRGRKDDSIRHPSQQPDEAICRRLREVFGHFKADRDVEFRVIRKRRTLDVKLLDIEVAPAAKLQSRIGIFQPENAATSAPEDFKKRSRAATDVNNAARLPFGENGAGNGTGAARRRDLDVPLKIFTIIDN